MSNENALFFDLLMMDHQAGYLGGNHKIIALKICDVGVFFEEFELVDINLDIDASIARIVHRCLDGAVTHRAQVQEGAGEMIGFKSQTRAGLYLAVIQNDERVD